MYMLAVIMQVEKGTQGIDGRVVNPRGKGDHSLPLLLITGCLSQFFISTGQYHAVLLLKSCNCACVYSDQRAFVITLSRAGEDNARFKLTDLDATFASFAGADYNLLVSHGTSVLTAARR